MSIGEQSTIEILKKRERIGPVMVDFYGEETLNERGNNSRDNAGHNTELNRKLRLYFDGKIVRKDLTKHIKRSEERRVGKEC